MGPSVVLITSFMPSELVNCFTLGGSAAQVGRAPVRRIDRACARGGTASTRFRRGGIPDSVGLDDSHTRRGRPHLRLEVRVRRGRSVHEPENRGAWQAQARRRRGLQVPARPIDRLHQACGWIARRNHRGSAQRGLHQRTAHGARGAARAVLGRGRGGRRRSARSLEDDSGNPGNHRRKNPSPVPSG